MKMNEIQPIILLATYENEIMLYDLYGGFNGFLFSFSYFQRFFSDYKEKSFFYSFLSFRNAFFLLGLGSSKKYEQQDLNLQVVHCFYNTADDNEIKQLGSVQIFLNFSNDASIMNDA